MAARSFFMRPLLFLHGWIGKCLKIRIFGFLGVLTVAYSK